MAKLRVKTKKPKVTAKATATDHAVATSKKPLVTDADKITTGNDLYTAMKASASWATATDVQSAANGWLSITTALSTNLLAIGSLREQLAAAILLQRGLRTKWVAGRKHVIGAVNVFCAGSASLIASLGFDEFVKSAADAEITIPSDIITSPGADLGEVDVAWDGVDRHGFMIQWATDVTNATTYSAMIPCTVASFTLTGQTSAATLHFRIAAIDPSQPSHMTAWSAWVAGTVH